MHVSIISIFPEMFTALDQGISGRALGTGLLTLSFWNPRDFTHDKHSTVDDRPYGGGPGMVMKAQPLLDAISAAKQQQPTAQVVYLSPQGQPLQQSHLQNFAMMHSGLILVCGRYEGIDERIMGAIDAEWSIGDYILSGGELAAMVVIDVITRCLPGALGHPESAQQDSFSQHRLDHPQYTRPEKIAGLSIPSVLNSGDHAAIARWRLKQSIGRTWQRRPDLLEKQPLTPLEEVLLKEFKQEI